MWKETASKLNKKQETTKDKQTQEKEKRRQ